MGTAIKLYATRGENTKDEVWDAFISEWSELYDGVEYDRDWASTGIIYCSYRAATIAEQLGQLKGDYKGSGIEINLYYEERDPDEVEVL